MGKRPRTPGGGFPGEPGIHPARLAPARSPDLSLKFIGGRAGFWFLCLLSAILLLRYKRSMLLHPLHLARLAFDLELASRAAPLCPSSLVPSYGPSSLLSEVGGAHLKRSGLRRSLLRSATQNLAYLPCRIESYASIFRSFVGGGVSKKPPARKSPRTLFSSRRYGQVCGHLPDL
jgi:hypothetical protein